MSYGQPLGRGKPKEVSYARKAVSAGKFGWCAAWLAP